MSLASTPEIAPRPPHATLVPFDEARTHEDFARWRALGEGAPPHLRPEFFALERPLLAHGEPLVAEAWDGDRMVGALPLLLEGRALSAMRTEHTPDFDFLGAPAALASIWRALREDPRWRTLVLKNVPKDSPLATELPKLAEADACPTVVRPGARHAYFELPGFEAKLAHKFLVNTKRLARKLDGLALERLPIPDRASFAEALAIEGRAWKASAGSDIASEAEVARFYRALTRWLGRRGEASLYFLKAGGKRIAMLLAIEDGHTLYALKIGYDPEFAAYGPGHLMVWQAALDAEKRGLRVFDFVGYDDEWKRKWTEASFERVTVIVYRCSLDGFASWVLNERVRPSLHVGRVEAVAPLRSGCQRRDLVAEHTALERARGVLARGLGIRSGLAHALHGAPRRPTTEAAPIALQGAPSRFEVGSWVRVRDEAAIRATLDARGKLRGLAFVPQQFAYCGGVFRVQRHVRRICDDAGRFRTIARSVILEGADCGGHEPEPAGCGRRCPLWFRDEWLEPIEAPARPPPGRDLGRHARVRTLDEILATLDLHGRHDGVSFMPEMAALAGKRFAIVEAVRAVFELDRWAPPRGRIYLLDGTSCSGATVDAEHPCDRACALLWHEDWLLMEGEC